MLFRNLKSGNVVAATDETSIELMQRSAIYEAVVDRETWELAQKLRTRARKGGGQAPEEACRGRNGRPHRGAGRLRRR